MVWDGIQPRMIHNIIRLLPETIKETIRLKGGNHFKIPHHYDKSAEPTLEVGRTPGPSKTGSTTTSTIETPFGETHPMDS